MRERLSGQLNVTLPRDLITHLRRRSKASGVPLYQVVEQYLRAGREVVRELKKKPGFEESFPIAVLHFLDPVTGRACCKFTLAPPEKWPAGHYAVRDPARAECEHCLCALRADSDAPRK